MGLHHLGVAVDDTEEIQARYRKHYPRRMIIKENRRLPHGEVRIFDPDPIPSVFRKEGSASRTPNLVGCPASVTWRSMRSIPNRFSDFTRTYSGFASFSTRIRKSRKRPGYRNKHVGDGFSNVANQAFYNDEGP